MNHPLMNGMDPIKMELIKNAATQTAGKSGNSLAPVLMSLISSAQKKNIQFSSEEFDLIMDVIKDGKTKKEQTQIDSTINMVRSIMSSQKK